MKGQGCVDTAEEKGLFMQWWIIPSWKKSVRVTECSSAVESRQILKALGGALLWLFGVLEESWLPKIRVSGVFWGQEREEVTPGRKFCQLGRENLGKSLNQVRGGRSAQVWEEQMPWKCLVWDL